MKTVPLSGKKAAGRVVLVDDEDYELVTQHSWNVYEKIRENTRNNGPYAQAAVFLEDGRHSTIRMHKLITGWPMTDHADGNGLNNQRYNLRPATPSQSCMNRRKFVTSKSRFKGVTRMPSGRWQAYIQVNGRTTSLGTFADEAVAAHVRDAAARKLHGQYACLNFPDD